MAFYTICGKPDCTNFAHAAYVAHYLHEHLPNFKYRKIEKSNLEWPDFVSHVNKRNGWHMVKSPIIWKEINTWGGKAYLIGGLGEFWEYCFSYYGLESSIPKEELENLACDNLRFFDEEARKKSNEHRKYNVVASIFYTKDQGLLTEQLLEEFLKIPHFTKESGYFVKLHETSTDDFESEKNYLNSIAEYYNSLALFGDKNILEISKNEEDAIRQCDLLIFMEDFSRNGHEDYDIWMKRCSIRVSELADIINMYGKRELRIIFCNTGPICFMATCMIEYCTVLIPSNIVALTSDRGISVLSTISEKAGLPLSKINGPPVWGFIGINEYVDESNVIFKAHVYKPYKRALTTSETSTLPLGTMVSELRLMSYLLPNHHEEITKIVKERNKNIEKKLNRTPIWSKLKALRSLLMLWFAGEPTDQIISLGICSNGSFGILPGLVFSQPCIQDQKRRWKPFSNFPLVNETILSKIQEFVDESAQVVQSVGLCVNSYFSSSGSELTF